MFLLRNLSVWIWLLNIVFIFVACFDPSFPTLGGEGDLLPKGKLCRLSVLNVHHHVASKHGFAWLCLAVCKPSLSCCAFWLTPGSSVFGLQWLSVRLYTCNADGQHFLINTCQCIYCIGCQYNLWAEWNVYIDISLSMNPLSSQAIWKAHD